MVIAYKYPYGHDEALVGEKIVGLLRIVIHTLAAQSHVCDRFSKPVTGLTMRSRDLSSIGGETDQNLPDDNMFEQVISVNVEKILKGSLDLIPSPSVKIQIMGGKVYLR